MVTTEMLCAVSTAHAGITLALVIVRQYNMKRAEWALRAIALLMVAATVLVILPLYLAGGK